MQGGGKRERGSWLEEQGGGLLEGRGHPTGSPGTVGDWWKYRLELSMDLVAGALATDPWSEIHVFTSVHIILLLLPTLPLLQFASCWIILDYFCLFLQCKCLCYSSFTIFVILQMFKPVIGEIWVLPLLLSLWQYCVSGCYVDPPAFGLLVTGNASNADQEASPSLWL